MLGKVKWDEGGVLILCWKCGKESTQLSTIQAISWKRWWMKWKKLADPVHVPPFTETDGKWCCAKTLQPLSMEEFHEKRKERVMGRVTHLDRVFWWELEKKSTKMEFCRLALPFSHHRFGWKRVLPFLSRYPKELLDLTREFDFKQISRLFFIPIK